MGLQRFKLNIANSVISQDNASLSSMGTDQLLDLFHVGESRVEEQQAKPAQPGLRGMLEVGGFEGAGWTPYSSHNQYPEQQDLEKIWNETNYEDYDVDKFMRGMTGKSEQ